MIKLPTRRDGESGLISFATDLLGISRQIGFKVSARGWCYQLEQFGVITKAGFDRVESIINKCRDKGYLPIDFTAEEEGRKFSGVEIPETMDPSEFIKSFLSDSLDCERFYVPDWWEDEQYYIQMVVEKIDLKTLFEPVCQFYHIPIATSKGWSSKLQRGEYARRFKEAENDELDCVLLYCGDFDPDGRRISEFLRSNLDDLKGIIWEDDFEGYDPSNLKIERFGLNYDFIEENRLSWIENLITGSKKDLASPSHPNHFMPYVQEYLRLYGPRKCEANALVVQPARARELCRNAIEKYLGEGADARFNERWDRIKAEMDRIRATPGVGDAIRKVIEQI